MYADDFIRLNRLRDDPYRCCGNYVNNWFRGDVSLCTFRDPYFRGRQSMCLLHVRVVMLCVYPGMGDLRFALDIYGRPLLDHVILCTCDRRSCRSCSHAP